MAAALRAGTRHIDTATIYKNEEAVGAAVRKSGVPRADIFVTSKVSPYEQGTARARAAVAATLERLGLEYVDLVLVHWPGVARVPHDDPRVRQLRAETWRALEEEVARGTVRSIGVSNYEERHLRELLETATVRPAVNQVELHPRYQQRSLRRACEEMGVRVVAYASLGGGELLGDATVRAVAAAEGRTPAQVLLRWALDKGAAVLPKSVRPGRVAEQAEPRLLGWSLSEAGTAALDAMEDGHKYCWDPSGIP